MYVYLGTLENEHILMLYNKMLTKSRLFRKRGTRVAFYCILLFILTSKINDIERTEYDLEEMIEITDMANDESIQKLRNRDCSKVTVQTGCQYISRSNTCTRLAQSTPIAGSEYTHLCLMMKFPDESISN